MKVISAKIISTKTILRLDEAHFGEEKYRPRPSLDLTKAISAKIILTKTILGLDEAHFGEHNFG
jgi:hypothetical protein